MKLRVVSYNVLSSHLSGPTQYTTLKPEHLDPKNRLPVVLGKLEAQIEEKKKSVICLQEVSYEWAGAMHVFFAQRGYHLVTGLYGKKFNGYMGVALAWPTDCLETIDVNISRLSDKRVGGWPDKDEKTVVTKFWDLLDSSLRYLNLKDSKPEIDSWEYSQYRTNVILTATLRDKESGQSFCIGNYHMPCAFFAPQIMTIHSQMAAKHVQAIAASKNNPNYVLAGDFNIKPKDPMYDLLTTGKLDKGHPSYPATKNGYEWEPTFEAMRSAYAAAPGSEGKEPDFTNYARVKEDEPFIDTLDYIFLSPSWQVADVLSLPHRDEAGGPFPNLEKGEPSDHVLIAADLVLNK